MDAALQVQQAAVNLGIQEGTLPSEMITGSTGLGASGATRADGRDAQEAMGIFSGGRARGLNGTAGDGLAIDGLNVGLAEGRMGAGRAKEDDRGPIPIVAGHVAAQNFDLKVDPNEPRYCYCDNVSFGEMIGCEVSRFEQIRLALIHQSDSDYNSRFACARTTTVLMEDGSTWLVWE
jgi:hypothetical protein